jgi:hypothetical protein
MCFERYHVLVLTACYCGSSGLEGSRCAVHRADRITKAIGPVLRVCRTETHHSHMASVGDVVDVNVRPVVLVRRRREQELKRRVRQSKARDDVEVAFPAECSTRLVQLVSPEPAR